VVKHGITRLWSKRLRPWRTLRLDKKQT